MRHSRVRRLFLGSILHSSHPLHPYMAHFGVSLLAAAFFLDCVTWSPAAGSEAGVTSYWLLVAGSAFGLVAAMSGWVEFANIEPDVAARKTALIHGLMNVLVLCLALVNVFARISNYYLASYNWNKVVSVVSLVIILVSSWIGGLLVFKYRVGVQRQGHGLLYHESYGNPNKPIHGGVPFSTFPKPTASPAPAVLSSTSTYLPATSNVASNAVGFANAANSWEGQGGMSTYIQGPPPDTAAEGTDLSSAWNRT